MKLKSVEIRNYRAVERLDLPLDPRVTVLHGDNAHGKTSVLSAIAVGLGAIPRLLPDVSGIGFLKTDQREKGTRVSVTLTTTDSVTWERTWGRVPFGTRFEDRRPSHPTKELRQWLDENARRGWGGQVDLPLMVYYDTDRAVLGLGQQRRRSLGDKNRYSALAGALSARTSFREFFDWFYAKENEELREQRSRRNHDYRLKELSAVRAAISSMLDGVSDPHVEMRPKRFVVTEKLGDGTEVVRALDQLSGGCRAVLALAADLAWRLAQGNPHRHDALESEVIVLIDEIELHLHPAWQQRILSDLMRTFPNAQFIVSTHSPQVLTTARPECIVGLRREDDRVVASGPDAPTYGAEAGDVLSSVMGVNERPENDFKTALDKYIKLVSDGQGTSPEAHRLRLQLQELSPYDPGLDRADVEIRRQRVIKELRKSR